MSPADQRDIPNPIVSYSAVKQGRGEVAQSCYFSISPVLVQQQLAGGEQLGFFWLLVFLWGENGGGEGAGVCYGWLVGLLVCLVLNYYTIFILK